MKLEEALDLLSRAKCDLNLQDYINMWGDHVGNHIWRQEGSDLLRIWISGLTVEQKKSFVDYVSEKVDGKVPVGWKTLYWLN